MVGRIEVVGTAFEDRDFETSLAQGTSQTDHHTSLADSACGTGYDQAWYADGFAIGDYALVSSLPSDLWSSRASLRPSQKRPAVAADRFVVNDAKNSRQLRRRCLVPMIRKDQFRQRKSRKPTSSLEHRPLRELLGKSKAQISDNCHVTGDSKHLS